MGKISVFKGSNSWMADFKDSTNGNQVKELFGTFQLPLPYTLAADGENIAAGIRKNYPADNVVLLESVA